MEKLMVYTQPVSPVTEAYRALCTNILAGVGERKLIEIAAVTDNNRACIVAANLATAMAQAGKKLLLIDCNLRNSKLHDILGLQNQGLTDCLVSVHNYQNFIQQTKQRNLDVLTAGNTVTNPVETLLSQPMQDLLNFVSEAYDMVLLNVPALDSVGDAAALGAKTDGIILVLVNKEDKVDQTKKAKDILAKADVAILGCVLDKVCVSRHVK